MRRVLVDVSNNTKISHIYNWFRLYGEIEVLQIFSCFSCDSVFSYYTKECTYTYIFEFLFMKQGFTLLELVVTISILGILFSITVPTLYETILKSRFSLEVDRIIQALSDTRNDVLARRDCSDDEGIQFRVNNDLVSFGCEQTLVLQESRIVFEDSFAQNGSIGFSVDPFAMELITSSGNVSQTYFTIESQNISSTEIYTVCLDSVLAYPKMYKNHCDCFDTIPYETIPDCEIL